MPIKRLDSNQARNHWRDLLDMVQANDTDVVITRYNRPVVVVVAYNDYVAVQEELRKRRAGRRAQRRIEAEAVATMIASEQVLAKEWDTPEEDAAWADL
jgi:prevent-host-death family protein